MQEQNIKVQQLSKKLAYKEITAQQKFFQRELNNEPNINS